VGQVEQVGPLGVVELEGAGDRVQHARRDPSQGASLELGVVLDAHPGQGVAGAVRLRLRIGDDVATATLEDSAPARDFAAMLPTTIRMHDLLGREKPGRLPRQLSIEGARREFDYQVGELAYWPPGNEIAIFYADDGQTIPQPGLVRLGSIDSGLEVIAAAGNDFQLTIEPLD